MWSLSSQQAATRRWLRRKLRMWHSSTFRMPSSSWPGGPKGSSAIYTLPVHGLCFRQAAADAAVRSCDEAHQRSRSSAREISSSITAWSLIPAGFARVGRKGRSTPAVSGWPVQVGPCDRLLAALVAAERFVRAHRCDQATREREHAAPHRSLPSLRSPAGRQARWWRLGSADVSWATASSGKVPPRARASGHPRHRTGEERLRGDCADAGGYAERGSRSQISSQWRSQAPRSKDRVRLSTRSCDYRPTA